MSNKEFKNYPDVTNINKSDLSANSSLAKMLSLVGSNKRVVDFGCATGYFAKLLREEGCEVVGVELNPEAAKVAEKYCKEVVVADLDYVKIEDVFEGQTFDVATFGDVLEHIKNPWQLLKAVRRILNPNGFVVASIPNIAHGAVRLSLLEGEFEYREVGLLDNTHLRFFTRSSVGQLFSESGYAIQVEDSVHWPLFNSTPYTPNLNKDDIPSDLVDKVLSDRDSEVLQFIIRAYPWSMATEYNELKDKNAVLRSHSEKISLEFQKSQAELQRTQTELQRTQTELQRMQTELQRTQTELQQAQKNWEHCQNVIEAMKSSKFWKIRQKWIAFKS
ncbi:class I SAM-dependent methyltransferase [Leptothoe spongobia]|uniref:Methyltransferase domain-containing protein n=1 Tax=Leptothoe spongobia TAU-MAC 1115 TaxID=1967444 RepID=A0A947GKG9_9CYAN|nr:class I SAM-dependent methyltransferase [Leptothoe spongobia]MBT9316768.1 methyltransferase domain-containing protein [Leptothoe spongobia TAU-MAC 1115]